MKHLKVLIGFFLAISFLFFSSVPVSALDMSVGAPNYLFTDSNGLPYWTLIGDTSHPVHCTQGGSAASNWGYATGNGAGLQLQVYNSAGCSSGFPLAGGGVLAIQIRTRGLTIDEAKTIDPHYTPVYIAVENQGYSSYWTIYIQNKTTTINSNAILRLWLRGTESQQDFEVLGWQVFVPSSSPNYSSQLSTINNNIQGVISGVGGVQSSVNSAANQAHQDSQAEVDAVNDLKDQQQQQWEEEENTTSDSQGSAESDADSAVSDTESATSSLFDVLTSVVVAITNASAATNCNIDMSSLPLGLGSVDICDFPVPTFITVIGSILAIVILLPIAISVLRDIIGLLESFTK